MTHDQARAARAFLGLAVRDVAASIGVALEEVTDIEASPGTRRRGNRETTLFALRSWYNRQGVTFLESGDVAIGHGVSYQPGVSVNQVEKKPRVVMK